MTRRSRRDFLKLAGAAALAQAAAALPARAAESVKRPRAAPPAVPAAVRAEIDSQKEYLAKTLKTIREFPLPPGSEPAMVFEPLEPRSTRDPSSTSPKREIGR